MRHTLNVQLVISGDGSRSRSAIIRRKSCHGRGRVGFRGLNSSGRSRGAANLGASVFRNQSDCTGKRLKTGHGIQQIRSFCLTQCESAVRCTGGQRTPRECQIVGTAIADVQVVSVVGTIDGSVNFESDCGSICCDGFAAVDDRTTQGWFHHRHHCSFFVQKHGLCRWCLGLIP